MRIITLLLSLVPMLSYSQVITIDTVGNAPRISFGGPANSILMGFGSGNSSSTGTFNTYIGSFNGSNNTSGEGNVAIGSNTGQLITSGSNNVSLGAISGYSILEGIGNVNLGYSAGFTDDMGNYNVRIGYEAGYNSKGNRNIHIGLNAGNDWLGDDQLFIANNSLKPALIHGDFAKDSLSINGDLTVTGAMNVGSIDVSKITGILGNGYSAVFPVVLDNTVTIEILTIVSGEFLITNSIGFEIDTFSLFGSTCLDPNTGLTQEFPLTFETDNPTYITALDDWFANPTVQSMSVIIKNVSGIEQFRYNLYGYNPGSKGAGSDGRISYTLVHEFPPTSNTAVEFTEFLGSSFSFNPATDKLVEIVGITHTQFNPAVEVNYGQRVITLEMTYNEGDGLISWINNLVDGIIDKRSMIINETTDGTSSTVTSTENFYEAVPFKFEVIYGYGLNTKIKARIQLLYGCYESL